MGLQRVNVVPQNIPKCPQELSDPQHQKAEATSAVPHPHNDHHNAAENRDQRGEAARAEVVEHRTMRAAQRLIASSASSPNSSTSTARVAERGVPTPTLRWPALR